MLLTILASTSSITLAVCSALTSLIFNPLGFEVISATVANLTPFLNLINPAFFNTYKALDSLEASLELQL